MLSDPIKCPDQTPTSGATSENAVAKVIRNDNLKCIFERMNQSCPK
jgi:hypothetical protein